MSQNNKNNKIIFLLVVIIVTLLVFGLGFILGAEIFKNQDMPTPIELPEAKVLPEIKVLDEAKVLEIRRQVLDDLRAKWLLAPLPKKVYELDGKIVSIDKNSLILEPKKRRGINPLGLIFPNILKVRFAENAVFYKIDWKSREQWDKERNEHLAEIERREKAGELLDGLIPPSSYIYTSIQNVDLKVGDYVRIVSKSNILGKEEIEAKGIQVFNKIAEDYQF